MSGNSTAKAVVLFDNTITQELRDWIKENGASEGGRKLLRLGYLLEKTGLADQIMLLNSHPAMVGRSPFEVVKQAVEMIGQIGPVVDKKPEQKAPQKQAVTTPEQSVKPAASSVFNAGKVSS